MSTTLVAAAVLGESGVLYNIDRFTYLGAPDGSTQHVSMTRKELGLSTLEKLRTTSGIRIGAQSRGLEIDIAGRVFAFSASRNPNLLSVIPDPRSISLSRAVRSMPEHI